jgi:hypothetical protein
MIGSALHSALPSDASAPSDDGQADDVEDERSEEVEGDKMENGDDEDDASTARAESPSATPQALQRDLNSEPGEEDEEPASSASGSESDSDSDSNASDSSDSASSSEEESDEEDDESDDEDLDRLLAAARQSAQRKAEGVASSASASEDADAAGLVGFGDESVLTLEKENEVKDAYVTSPVLSPLSSPSRQTAASRVPSNGTCTDTLLTRQTHTQDEHPDSLQPFSDIWPSGPSGSLAPAHRWSSKRIDGPSRSGSGEQIWRFAGGA